MVVAALALKDTMDKNGIKGRLMLWPGVAEELLATKAYYVRAGMFKDVDASIFVHVGRDLGTSAGARPATTAWSASNTRFKGKTAHAAGQPWDGRSALDGVEIMNTAWNFRREHLPVTQRSHYVITNGGGQPNIVPDKASVWYYFREGSFAKIRALYRNRQQDFRSRRAWRPTPRSRARCSAMPRPISATSRWPKPPMPISRRSACRNGAPPIRALPRRCRPPTASRSSRLSPRSRRFRRPKSRGPSMGGGSDDIGDIMWTVPTITIRYPSNIPNAIGHNVPIGHRHGNADRPQGRGGGGQGGGDDGARPDDDTQAACRRQGPISPMCS